MTATEEIADFRQVRPHLVVLGAGASRAAFPDGELRGRELPLMADFAEIVPVAPILEKAGIDCHGKNFEDLYSLISENSEYRAVQEDLEEVVFDYFADLRLPERPTLYDALVLCLRQKDIIATFNWDPFLIQAYQRSRRVTNSLPTSLFLHGNVAHGYCDRDRFQGLRGDLCPRCLDPFQPEKLLFPIARKDYSSDPFFESFLAIHPRRSIEAFLNQYIHANFLEGNRVIEAKTLDELHNWFRPLVEAERRERD